MWAPEAMLSAKRMGALPGFDVDVIAADPPGDWQGENQSLEDYVGQRFGSVTRVRRRPVWDHVRLGRFSTVIDPSAARLMMTLYFTHSALSPG